jgi:hypothetical protein
MFEVRADTRAQAHVRRKLRRVWLIVSANLARLGHMSVSVAQLAT